MLPYENDVVLELLNQSSLIITSRGLGIHRLFCAFLKLYAADSKCYFVLNTSPTEQRFLIEETRLIERFIKQENDSLASDEQSTSTSGESVILPKVITSDNQYARRVEIYKTGGVIFVSSRILLVDLLLNRVPANYIGGALIWNAHRVVETAQESLICSILYRLNNSAAFRAFSDAPTRFAFAFGPLRIERVMRNVHARRMILLPRFHANVSKVFDNAQRRNLVLTELHATASETFRTLEMTLSAIIRSLLTEFREASTRQRLAAFLPESSSTTTADSEATSAPSAFEISFDNCVLLSTSAFERLVRCAVEPAWQSLGERARRLLLELRTVQSFLSRLHTLDAISFHRALLAISSTTASASSTSASALAPVDQNADWLVMDETSRLFELARRCVFGIGGETNFDARRCDVNPKWCALLQCLAELRSDVATPTRTPILIVCESRYTVRQLRGLLRFGTIQLLERIWRLNDNEVDNYSHNEGENELDVVPNVLSFELVTTETDRLASIADEIGLLNSIHEKFSFVFTASNDPVFELRFIRALETIRPRHVILYDPDMRAIRQLEVHVAVQDARNEVKVETNDSVKVYFLLLKDSVEEQRYLNALRQEKTAFESLIREQNSVTVSFTQDDPFVPPNDFLDAETDAGDGDGEQSSVWSGGRRPRAIVDMREFRSELPCVLFTRGFEVVPRTLQIGDYLLTVANQNGSAISDAPVVCIERKSLPDLNQSLASGRLYAQCVQMCRAYDRPVLLIEFDLQSGFAPFVRRAESPFSGGAAEPSTGGTFYDLQSKLVLLVLRFPKLRIVWAPNAYCSSELFHEMIVAAQRNRFPSLRKQTSSSNAAVSTAAEQDQDQGDDSDPAIGADAYRFRPVDLLLKLPGVTHKNVQFLVKKFASLRAVSNASEEELFSTLNNREEARRLFAFFHKSVAANADLGGAEVDAAEPDLEPQRPQTSRRPGTDGQAKRPRGPSLHLAALVKEKRPKGGPEQPPMT